jgi:hypothetical protein
LPDLGEGISSPSTDSDPVRGLVSSFFPKELSKERFADLVGRARLGDIEGLAAEAGIPNREALRFARGLSLIGGDASARKVKTTPTRQLLRTPDARRLARELLAIFAKEASSRLARNRFLFLLSPTLDEGTLQKRFESYLRGKEVFEELQRKGKLAEARGLLSTLSISQGETAAAKKKSPPSDVTRYFASRRRMLETADSFLQNFPELKQLTSFLLRGEDVSPDILAKTKNALKQILKHLKEVDELSVPDPEALISDAEVSINDELRRKRSSLDRERVKQLVENQAVQISSALGMNQQEEEDLMKAVFEGLVSSTSSSSFEFDRHRVRGVLDSWRQRRTEELRQMREKVEDSLRGFIDFADSALERLVMLDQTLATASLIQKYSLVIPKIGRGVVGIGFKNGLSLFLLQQHEGEKGKADATAQGTARVEPVSYSIGATTAVEGAPRNVVMLTGANSGGKTTLLTTLASIHILSLYGLPVPCESAELLPMPICLFRRRITKKIGSLEQALRSLIPVFASDARKKTTNNNKLILIDEFEALTEPGAAGRIIATMMNKAALSSSNLVLLVTHLARETLPHIKLPIRVDGIEASGFDPKTGELIVDRQPKFNHIGTSSPQHIVRKLSKQSSAKGGVRALYSEILEALDSDSSVPFQAPLLFPWMTLKDE